MVTLRGQRMYEFFDRLVNAALPRIRDFRGCSPKAFDGRGNYSLGVREQLIFPEIDYDKVDRIRGMQINICTTAQERRRRQAAARASWHAVREEAKRGADSVAKISMIVKSNRTAEVPGAAAQPLQALRPAARLHPHVRACAASASGKLALEGQIPGVTKSSW